MDQPNRDPNDRTADLEARLAELERRTAPASSGRSGIEAAFWAVMHSIFPDEARKHLKAAGREQLLAARVYLDQWIAKMDEEKAQTDSRPREKIEIE
jgi:hypothetical protein